MCFVTVALAYSVLCTYCKETVGVIFFPIGQAWPHIPVPSTWFCNTEKRNFCISRAVLGSAEGNSLFFFLLSLQRNIWLSYIQVSLEE